MKKICLITPNSFPVPAIKGGAVETIVNYLIDENEKEGKINFTVVSIYDKKLSNIKYKNTQFVYIKVPLNIFFEKLKIKFNEILKKVNSKINKKISFIYIFRLIISFIIRILRVNEIIYEYKIYNRIKNKEFDYIVIEGGNPLGYKKCLKHFKKEKCLLHIHGKMEGLKIYDSFYSNYIAVSNFIKNKFTDNGIISKDKVFVVQNCIDIDRFSQVINEHDKKEIYKQYNLKKEDFIIMYCGRIVPEKGVKELISAFNLISNNDVKLLLVGSSNFNIDVLNGYEQEVQKLVEDSNGKIVATGFIHNKDIYKFYNIANVFVLPTLCEEASPLVIVEALAAGKPVIITSSGGALELIDENVGFIVDKDKNLVNNIFEKLKYFINNNENCIIMGNNAKKRAMKYSIENTYNKFFSVIERLN